MGEKVASSWWEARKWAELEKTSCPPCVRPRQAAKQTQDQGTWTAGPPHVLIELARPPRADPRSRGHPAALRPELSPPGPARSSPEGRELPGRAPHSTTPRHEDRQAVRPQASGSWQRRRGPPTWPLIAASAARHPPFRSPRPGPVAPWRPPWRRSGGGGWLARLSLVPRPLGG